MNAEIDPNEEGSIFEVRRTYCTKDKLSFASAKSPPSSPCNVRNALHNSLPSLRSSSCSSATTWNQNLIDSPQALKELVAKAASEKLDLYRNTASARRQGRRNAFCLKKRKRDDVNETVEERHRRSSAEFLDLLQVPICDESGPPQQRGHGDGECDGECDDVDEDGCDNANRGGHEDNSPTILWLSMS